MAAWFRDYEPAGRSGQTPRASPSAAIRSVLVTTDTIYTSIGDSGNATDQTDTERQKIWKFRTDGSGKELFVSATSPWAAPARPRRWPCWQSTSSAGESGWRSSPAATAPPGSGKLPDSSGSPLRLARMLQYQACVLCQAERRKSPARRFTSAATDLWLCGEWPASRMISICALGN